METFYNICQMLCPFASNGGINRDTLFNVTTQITFASIEEFNRQWLIVDNVWIQRNKTFYTSIMGDLIKSYKCRLSYNDGRNNTIVSCSEDPLPRRHKPSRKSIVCRASIRVVFTTDGKVVVNPFSINSTHNNNHCHDIQVVDQVKLCTFLRQCIMEEVSKGYPLPAIRDVFVKSDKFCFFWKPVCDAAASV